MKLTTTAVFAITVLTSNLANAGITCSASECKAETMPLLDQMESSVKSKFGSMACVPTSSMMVMESVFSSKKDIVAGSFTDSIYQQNSYGAILLMGNDMKTTSQNGTYVNDAQKTFTKIAQGFSGGASSFSVTNVKRTISPANLMADMKSGMVGSLLFASYIPKCSSMASGRKSCSFTRQYGHSVAVQAASASQVQIFDPSDDKWTSQLLRLQDDSGYVDATLSLASHIGADARILAKNYYTQGEVDLAEYFYGIKIEGESSTPVVVQPSPTPTTPVVVQPSPTPTTPVVVQPSPTPTTPVVVQPSPTPTTPVVVQPTPKPSPVVVQPTPKPSPVVVQPTPKPTTPVVSQPPKSQVWQQWVKYFKAKGKFASRR
ncbi:hypothetical protein ACLVWU_17310 [Bdellovibrio sp. HCB290]|uniref:hypothetical protein n=1 Tax=Bdellovibrio sp. HCB290 TaxID=3394356 RepID=UPI0039B46C3F